MRDKAGELFRHARVHMERLAATGAREVELSGAIGICELVANLGPLRNNAATEAAFRLQRGEIAVDGALADPRAAQFIGDLPRRQGFIDVFPEVSQKRLPLMCRVFTHFLLQFANRSQINIPL